MVATKARGRKDEQIQGTGSGAIRSSRVVSAGVSPSFNIVQPNKEEPTTGGRTGTEAIEQSQLEKGAAPLTDQDLLKRLKRARELGREDLDEEINEVQDRINETGQAFVEAGATEEVEGQKNIANNVGSLNRDQTLFQKLTTGGLNLATDVAGTEAVGQSLRDLFGVGLNKKQLDIVRQANPEESEQFIKRIQQAEIERKNITLGNKIRNFLGATVEATPILGSIAKYFPTLQTPNAKVRTIAGKVGAFEAKGDKLGLAGESDPIGTIQNINIAIEEIDTLEAQLQSEVFRSADLQATGDAQEIAIKMATVRSNLENKRDDIASQGFLNKDSATPLDRQRALEQLDNISKDL